MSKYLRIGNGDYNIVTKEGGEITLDTTDGNLNGTGKVIITGGLEVQGDSTTYNSTVVAIADNILVLSKDNSASGLPASSEAPSRTAPPSTSRAPSPCCPPASSPA